MGTAMTSTRGPVEMRGPQGRMRSAQSEAALCESIHVLNSSWWGYVTPADKRPIGAATNKATSSHGHSRGLTEIARRPTKQFTKSVMRSCAKHVDSTLAPRKLLSNFMNRPVFKIIKPNHFSIV